MASLAATPKLSICAEKQQLSDAIVEATHALMSIHNEEITAFLAGGDGADGYANAIKQARHKLDRAKKLYFLHVSSHGC